MGFPENMNYGHRALVRKECSRFLRFSYLADFLTMECLRNIYKYSVNELIERLEDLHFGKKNDNTEGFTHSQKPLLEVKVRLDVEKPLGIIHESVNDFVPPPLGRSKPEDFDPNVHL